MSLSSPTRKSNWVNWLLYRFFNIPGLWVATSFLSIDCIRSVAYQESRKQWRPHFLHSPLQITRGLNLLMLLCLHNEGQERSHLRLEVVIFLPSFCITSFLCSWVVYVRKGLHAVKKSSNHCETLCEHFISLVKICHQNGSVCVVV